MDENEETERTARTTSGERADGAAPRARARAAAGHAPRSGAAALAAERDEIKDRMLRIAAEFENWKKRARKEQTDAVASARESVLRDMLEVADNLERAASAQARAATASSTARRS